MSMIELLLQAITDCGKADDEIAMVILQGLGDKAFCAGGDVVSLYHTLKEGNRKLNN